MRRNYSVKSRLTILALLLVGGLSARAQNVGIGTTAPDVSAALDIVSSSKGTLLPRMTQTQRNAIGTPATGLLIFQTDATPGFYYNAGTPGTPNWQQIATAAGAAVTANNGLTKTGANIQLGGPLVQATNIAQGGNAFSLTGGNVGVGLTTPAQLFDVNGTAVVRGNLGVGNTAPQLPLDVIGAGTGSIGFRNGAAWDHLYMYHDGSTAVVRAGGAETGLSLQVGASASGTYGDVSQAYVDVMRLLPTGRVGIGTAAPTALLDVNGSTRLRGLTTAGVVTTDASGNLSSGSAASLDATTASNGLTLVGNDVRLGGTLTGATTIAQAGFNLGLTGGNFGVGIAAPTSKAQVNLASDAEQGLRVSDGTTASNIVIQPLVGTNSGFQAINYNGYFNGGEQRYNAAKNRWRVGVDQRPGNDLFFIDTYNGVGSTPLAILPNGNVGLGNTTPLARLDVQGGADANGTTSVAPDLAFSYRLGGYRHFVQSRHNSSVTGAGNDLDFYLNNGINPAASSAIGTGNVHVLTMENNNGVGRVGIGTIAPSQALDVNGTAKANNALVLNEILLDVNDTNNGTFNGQNALKFGAGNSGEGVGSKRTAAGNQFGLDFFTGYTSRMSVTNAGNVGIGTTAPTALLDVNGSTRLRGLTVAGLVQTDALGNLSSASTASFGTSFIQNQNAADQVANFRISGSGYVAGKIGIGNTAPIQDLDLTNGAVRAGGFDPFTAVSATNQGAHLQWNRSGSEGETWLINHIGLGGANAGIRFAGITTSTGTVPTEWARFNNAGNFGIGTTTPNFKLEVNGNTGIDGGNVLEFGAGVAGKEVNAGKIGYGTFSGGGALDIVGAGTTGANRRIQFFNEGGATFNGNIGVLAAPVNLYALRVEKTQLTGDGDGQGTTYAYRTRDSQNDGVNYSVDGTNSANKSYNFWGDLYTFGTAGFSFNDLTRTGGVLGAKQDGAYWGSLGYRASSSTGYGVYGSAAYNSGGGRSGNGGSAATEGIGLGAYGGALGGWVSGEALGLITSGAVYAAYNVGDVYTSGRQAELVTTATGQRQATYTVSSAQSKVYEDGVSELQNGRATIAWPENFAGMLGAVPVVTVTPIGECQGLHIVSLSKDGFIVAENGSGTHSLTFTWIAVGKRVDVTNKAVPAELLDPAYDAHLKEVMVNDNDPSKTATPLWHDGQRTRFSPAPSTLRPVVKPAR